MLEALTEWLYYPLALSHGGFVLAVLRYVTCFLILHQGVHHLRRGHFFRGGTLAVWAGLLWLGTLDLPANPNAQIANLSTLGLLGAQALYFGRGLLLDHWHRRRALRREVWRVSDDAR